MSASLDGTLSGDWSYDVAVTHGVSNALTSTEDTITTNFSSALRGLGGSGCDAATGTPGVGPCEFYNPFSTSFNVLPNSQNVLDFIIGTQTVDSKSELTVIDAVVSGSVGDVGLAFGVQYRDESFSQDFDAISEADGFAFLIGGQDFERSRNAKAIFAEAFVPLADTLDFSAAVRYEDYGGNIGDTLDPKFSLLWRPTDELSLRGSYSTSFRAPSVFQEAGVNTSLNQVVDPLGGTAFAAVRTLPAAGRNVGPEQGEALNFGLSYQSGGLELDIDYWRYDFTNVIIQENFQAIVNADPQGDRVIRAGGDTGNILIVLVDFVNASAVTTNGLDVNFRYSFDTDIGIIQPFFEGTRVFGYDINDPQAGQVEGAGNRNFSNFGSPTPKTRYNTGLAFMNDVHDARFYVRHISSFNDDQNPGQTVGSWTSVDAQYTLNLGGLLDGADGTSLQFGVINAFDKTAPQVFTNGGFESRTHDPRGRMVYGRISARF